MPFQKKFPHFHLIVISGLFIWLGFTARTVVPDEGRHAALQNVQSGSFSAEAEVLLQIGDYLPINPMNPSACCTGKTGNIDQDAGDVVDITDLTVLIDHLFISFTPLPCIDEANIDGDMGGVIDITDVSFLIDHLFISLVATSDCIIPPVSYANDVKPILAVWCTAIGCHGSGPFSGGFTMGATAEYGTVRTASGFNGSIIVAGNASASNLYLKTTSSPPFPLRMPSGGPFLSIAQQNSIRDWINQGALDN